VNVDGGDISYVPTEEAIKQRHVDTSEIALFESMGVCFGRKPEKYEPSTDKHTGPITRYM
jgi:6-phosphofructokinase 1